MVVQNKTCLANASAEGAMRVKLSTSLLGLDVLSVLSDCWQQCTRVVSALPKEGRGKMEIGLGGGCASSQKGNAVP